MRHQRPNESPAPAAQARNTTLMTRHNRGTALTTDTHSRRHGTRAPFCLARSITQTPSTGTDASGSTDRRWSMACGRARWRELWRCARETDERDHTCGQLLAVSTFTHAHLGVVCGTAKPARARSIIYYTVRRHERLAVAATRTLDQNAGAGDVTTAVGSISLVDIRRRRVLSRHERH